MTDRQLAEELALPLRAVRKALRDYGVRVKIVGPNWVFSREDWEKAGSAPPPPRERKGRPRKGASAPRRPARGRVRLRIKGA